MKEKILGFTIAIILSVTLSACSKGIDQAEYDRVVSESEELKKRNDELQGKYDDLQKQYDNLQAEHEKFKDEYAGLLEEKAENLVAELPNTYAQAWVDTSFSGKGVCAASDDTLFVSMLTGKSATEKNVKEMRKELFSSISTYTFMKLATPDSFPWKSLSVTFYDASGAGIFQFTMDTDESAALKSILLDAMRSKDIAEWIQ